MILDKNSGVDIILMELHMPDMYGHMKRSNEGHTIK